MGETDASCSLDGAMVAGGILLGTFATCMLRIAMGGSHRYFYECCSNEGQGEFWMAFGLVGCLEQLAWTACSHDALQGLGGIARPEYG